MIRGRERAIEVLREIEADCERDAQALDGQPLTGRLVGETFGGTLAMVKGLARMLRQHIEQHEREAHRERVDKERKA